MKNRIKDIYKCLGLLAWLAFIVPTIWDDKEQFKSDAKHIAGWWVK